MELDDLRWRLFSALASSLAVGCGPAVGIPDGESGSASRGSEGDDDSATSATEGEGSSAATTMSPPTTTSTTSAGESDDDDVDEDDDDGSVKFDLMISDAPLFECPDQPLPPLEVCSAELPSEFDHYRFFCVDVPVDGGCEGWAAVFDEMYADEQPFDGWTPECFAEGEHCSIEYLREIGCGPVEGYVDRCCFWFVAGWAGNCPGRPFLVEGCERLADPTARADWARRTIEVDSLAPSIRTALADVWTQHALFEHASIASFSRFVLHLLACGAPAELVTAANLALGEEIQHAKLFFGFASAYAGAPVGPSALDVRDSLSSGSLAFTEIVLAAVREGCIAETISAWHVALAARNASDPSLARALEDVAAQELEHSVLAWRFLDWAWQWADDELRARIVETFAQAETSAPRAATAAAVLDDATLLAHGLLPAELHASSAKQVLRDVVTPAARTFLAARQRPRSGSESSKSFIIASTSAMPMRT